MMKRLFTLSILLLIALGCNAEKVEIGGLWYEVIAKDKTAEVIRHPDVTSYNGKYRGDIAIPEKVTYNGVKYSVTSIGEKAFKACHDLTGITIGNSVMTIGESAFFDCTSLTSITIPHSVTSIEGGIFEGCSKLADIMLPNSVTNIGNEAFKDCSSLTSFTFPNSVTSIGSCLFHGCSGLTSIIIPKSVTSIGSCLFHGCTNLSDIYCYAEEVPDAKSDAFMGAPTKRATLHVPANAIGNYKADKTWSDFGTIVKAGSKSVKVLMR